MSAVAISAVSSENNNNNNNQAKLKLDLARATKKNHDIEGVRMAGHQVSSFFTSLGENLESLIDKTPFGIPDEDLQPWDPETDKTLAALNDPIATLSQGVTEICESLPGMNATAQSFDLERAATAVIDMWASASQSLLMSVRRGLENAVEAEKKMNLVDGASADDVTDDADTTAATTTAPKQGGEVDAFVDLGSDNWGNSSRPSNPWNESVSEAKVIKKQVKKAVSDFTMNKFLPFVDNLTLRANGIIVTSDDCSVECSVASLVDTVSDGECPSIITEHDYCPSVVTEQEVSLLLDEIKDAVETPTDVVVNKKEEDQDDLLLAPKEIEIKINSADKTENLEENVVTDDESEDFVIAEEDSEFEEEDDDFVDLLDEDFDVTSVN